MDFRKTTCLSLNEKQQILELWNGEYPRDLKYENFEQFEDYLKNLRDQNHILVLDENQDITGWYVDFIRENERWFAVILKSEFQGKRIGTTLIQEVKKYRTELNGWVISTNDYVKCNDEPYRSPLGFYEKNGFLIHKDKMLKTTKIMAIKISWKYNDQS
ncbi:GNAT family N-acetyltransferase [Christiangramia echinicola]|uniref:GNAT family N-acetyltransferase n=1 Tax=Christiangramia echinicola TaxID=279359 RepID=UPI000479B43C|nr:GNAT family N-acetyltransferase [Christiangramia echinicola]